jgi:hypothetical protein
MRGLSVAHCRAKVGNSFAHQRGVIPARRALQDALEAVASGGMFLLDVTVSP